MEEGPHELPMWEGNFNLEDVADYIPFKSENQSAYPCIDWVDRDIIGIKTVGGKEFNFCNKFFVVIVIRIYV